jgi:hypothetical protein
MQDTDGIPIVYADAGKGEPRKYLQVRGKKPC